MRRRLEYFLYWYRYMRWAAYPEFTALSLRQRLELAWKWSGEA